MFFLGTSVLEENKTFQCKDAKAYITTKTDSDFVIILSILLAGYISEGFLRKATQWQTELCLWKINYFDWIFKRHFNMVPLHITYEAWNAPEHSISHLASQENILVTVEKYFTAFATTVFRWKKEDHWSGSQPSFLKDPSLSIHITQSSHKLPNQGHNSAYRCISVNFPVSCPIEIIDHSWTNFSLVYTRHDPCKFLQEDDQGVNNLQSDTFWFWQGF